MAAASALGDAEVLVGERVGALADDDKVGALRAAAAAGYAEALGRLLAQPSGGASGNSFAELIDGTAARDGRERARAEGANERAIASMKAQLEEEVDLTPEGGEFVDKLASLLRSPLSEFTGERAAELIKKKFGVALRVIVPAPPPWQKLSAPLGDVHHDTPLMCAAGSGHVACVELLLQAGADPTHAAGVPSTTALHAAAAEGRLECAALLMKYGADPAAAGESGLCALDLAVAQEQVAGGTEGSEQIRIALEDYRMPILRDPARFAAMAAALGDDAARVASIAKLVGLASVRGGGARMSDSDDDEP